MKNGKAINLYQHLVRQLATNSSYCKQFKHFLKYNSRKMSFFETKIKHVDNLSKLFMAPSLFLLTNTENMFPKVIILSKLLHCQLKISRIFPKNNTMEPFKESFETWSMGEQDYSAVMAPWAWQILSSHVIYTHELRTWSTLSIKYK